MDQSNEKPGVSGVTASIRDCGKCIGRNVDHDGGEREEIVKLWRQMDEKLEHKAKSHNLSVVNVKTILHHLIRNPGVISLIMGIDDDASLPDLKLTRSKVKQLCRKNETEIGNATHMTEVVVVPRAERTFLDVDYEHNEEDDEDYNPDLDEAEAASEAEGDVELDDAETNIEDANNFLQVPEEGEADQPALHTRSRNHVVDCCLEDEPLCGDDVLLFSAIDDPDYMDFISTLNDPSRYEVDEAEDPEYNFMRDLECEQTPEKDELRMDRATEIPMREVENLLQDLFDSGLTNAQTGTEETSHNESKKDSKETESYKHPSPMSHRLWEPHFTDHITVLMGATSDDLAKIALDSAVLDGASLEKPPKFTASEVDQLKTQLKKHVQLLTQFMVGCHFESTLVDVRNECQKMINELYELSAEQPSNSLFNIKNLDASVITCHDAINCERVEFSEVNEPRYKKLNLPLPQTMLVLARSNALLYPELLPTVRLRSFPSFYQYFTAPEESLLAMGQYMFSHIPHSTASRRDGRNALIVRYFLPNKEISQIRLHMKNFRFSSEPIYEIITRAEQGMVTMIFPPERSESEQSTPPYMWHETVQPVWLQMLEKRVFYGSNAFTDKALLRDVSSEDVVIRQLPESEMATPCYHFPNKCVACCENETNGSSFNDISASEGDCNLCDHCDHGTRLLKGSCQFKAVEKISGGTESQNVIRRKRTSELSLQNVGRECDERKRKNSLECRVEQQSIQIGCGECMKSRDDGSVDKHDADYGQSRCGGGAVDSLVDIRERGISEGILMKHGREKDDSEGIQNTVNRFRTEVVPSARESQKDCGQVHSNSSSQAAGLSNEAFVLRFAETSSDVHASTSQVQTFLPNTTTEVQTFPLIATSQVHTFLLNGTSEVQTFPHSAPLEPVALIPETAGSYINVIPSFQMVFVPVLSNASWVVLAHLHPNGRQVTVGSPPMRHSQPVDILLNSANAPSGGNLFERVASTIGTESTAETTPNFVLSNEITAMESSGHASLHAANVQDCVASCASMKDTSLLEHSCAVSAVSDSDFVQTTNLSESVISAGEKSFLTGGREARSLKSVSNCSSTHNGDMLEVGQSYAATTLDTISGETSPHSSGAVTSLTENAQELITTQNLVEDMPDVDSYDVVKTSTSLEIGSVAPTGSAVGSSKPSTSLNGIVREMEGCDNPPTPEDWNSGLTVLFAARDDSRRGIREGTSPPPTPCWHHSPSIIDDSASKTRFSDVDGSQAEWGHDEWTPRTPGQRVEADGREKKKCMKASKALIMSMENLGSQRPAMVDCGVQWEPVNVLSNRESSSSPNTSSYGTSVGNRLPKAVVQDGIVRESLVAKEAECGIGDREGGQPNEEPKCKKRKRKERLRDGLKGMLNEEHRARQMRALSRVVLGDFKQRMFMHQHKIRAIQKLITSGPPSTQMFRKLKEILGEEHDLLLVLVSFLFPEDLISECILSDPMRKAYANAIEMMFNIEAYATFGRSKFSARSIFRYIRELGPFCTSEELQARLCEVVGSEDPLWSALSAYLPTAPHPQMHQQYEYEHVDTASWDVTSAEWEDVDMAYVLKGDTERRRKPAVIANGKLLVEKKGRLCEAIACFKCEETAIIDGYQSDNCIATATKPVGNEFRADASEVEIVLKEGCAEDSSNGMTEKEAIVKSSLRKAVTVLSVESATDEEAEESEKSIDGEDSTRKETAIVPVSGEPVSRRKMGFRNRTLHMNITSTENEKIGEGIVAKNAFQQSFEEKLLDARRNNGKTAGEVLSGGKDEKNLAKENNKERRLMEKSFERNGGDIIDEKLYKGGWQLIDAEEGIKKGKNASNCMDGQISGTLSIHRASFSETLDRGFGVTERLHGRITLCEQKSEKLCSAHGEANFGDVGMNLFPNRDRNKAVPRENIESAEVISKLKRFAGIVDNNVLTVGGRKKRKTEGDAISAANVDHRKGERESMGEANTLCNMSYKKKENFIGQRAHSEEDCLTEQRRRRSKSDLSITRSVDDLCLKNGFGDKQGGALVSNSERGRIVRWGNVDRVDHWGSQPEIGRIELIEGKEVIRRRQHPEVERCPHRRQYVGRFGRSCSGHNEEQLQGKTSSRDEYTYIIERDSLGREVWRKFWKRKGGGVVYHRWASSALLMDNAQFYHDRRSDEMHRISSGDHHRGSNGSPAERVVAKFGGPEVCHEWRPYNKRQLDNWRGQPIQGIHKSVPFVAEEGGYFERSYDRDESSEILRRNSTNVRSLKACFGAEEKRSGVLSSDVRGGEWSLQSLKKRVRRKSNSCERVGVLNKRRRVLSVTASDDRGEHHSSVDGTLHVRMSRWVELEPGEVLSDESCDNTEAALQVMQRQTESECTKLERRISFDKESQERYFGKCGLEEASAGCSQNAIESGYSGHETCGIGRERDEREAMNVRSENWCVSKGGGGQQPKATPSGKVVEFSTVSDLAWSREEDEELLRTYNQFDGDIEKVVCVFTRTIQLRDLAEVRERLFFLLSLF